MAAPTKSPWSSVQRTAGQTRWQSVVTFSNVVTHKVSFRTNSFVELGTGLNITNAHGQFIPANPAFTITLTGAEALGAAHQIIVPGDIASGAGIQVITPAGESLIFQPLAIDYFDPVDGQGVLLDVVTNAVGWLVASNEIVFSNCFTHIKASIRLRNTRAGLESDLILHENPPEPQTFGLSAYARLEMLTEQLAGPTPVLRPSLIYAERDPVQAAAMLEPQFVDNELTYGTMKMGAGRAFLTPLITNVPPAARSSRVAKSFLELENRKIVIEAVEHRRVRPALLLLPLATNLMPHASLAPLFPVERLAKNTRRLPAWPVSGETREAALQNKKPQPVQHARLAAPADATASGAATLGGTGYQPVPPGDPPGGTAGRADEPADTLRLGAFPSVPRGESPRGTGRLPVLPTEPLASASAPSPSFVLDYYLVSIYGENDFTFRGDTTYWVSSPVGLTGTTTFEGGTVLKFSEATGLYFTEEDAVVCDTTHHLPAVFTSYDDNSVGEDLGGSGAPEQISTWGLYFMSGSRKLENVRFTYLSHPIAMEGGGSANDLTLRNVQVRKSDYVVDSGTTDIEIYNGLFVDCGMIFMGADDFLAEHVTIHHATVLGGSATTATVRNSLLVEVANAPSYFGTYTTPDTASLTNDVGVFETAAGGRYYLPLASTNRNAGTTFIDAQLKAALAGMTVTAPEEITGLLLTNRSLAPRPGLRDADSLPDRGYHYPAVDYFADGVTMENSTITLSGGVVFGASYSNFTSQAIYLNPGKLISLGTPTAMNRILRLNQVQENPIARGDWLFIDGDDDDFYPQLNLQFTEVSALAGEYGHINSSAAFDRIQVSHSSFLNGGIYCEFAASANQIVAFTNNLFRSVVTSLDGASSSSFFAYNNLFLDGSIKVTNGNSGWRISDNVFDRTTVTDDAGASVGNKNAYVAGVGPLSFDASPVTLTNLAYEHGPLGRYYLADATLLNAGSRDADEASLYHFTTTPIR